MKKPTPTLKIDTAKGTTKAFEIYDLAEENDPILATPTIYFDFDNPPIHPNYLSHSLFETMFKNKGIGLTANQCGVPYAVFVVGMDQDNKQVFFNPKIKNVAEEEETQEEGCLSYKFLVLKVKRPIALTLEFQGPDGKVQEQVFTGLTGRIILHEMDHILGKRFTDNVGPVSLKRAKEKRAKLLKKLDRKQVRLIDDETRNK